MAIVAVYLLICAVRTSMPAPAPPAKIRVFLTRFIATAIGVGLAYGFLWLCIHRGLVPNPDDARKIMWLIVGLFVVTGEFLSRRYLRSLNIVPKNRVLPWTY